MLIRFTLSVLLLSSVLATAVFLFKGSSGTVAALPESAQARYIDMTVTTSDGSEFELPDRTVTCSLELVRESGEGVYSCPEPHDINTLISPPQVSADPFAANAATLVEVDAATIFWGFPANTWQTVQINYGVTLSSANVFLGPELTAGETGHIENSVWPDFTRGVGATSFLYRAKANSSGYLGTEWLARGTQ